MIHITLQSWIIHGQHMKSCFRRVPATAQPICLPAMRLQDGSYRWIVGSSFHEGEDDLAAREASDDFNREQARRLVDFEEGDLSSLMKAGEFVGVRCVAGDRLPIIGALPQRPGIFLATALGSRGILWSALAAKLITAQLLEDDFALLARFGFAADLVAALAPARFFAGALAAPSALGAFASNSNRAVIILTLSPIFTAIVPFSKQIL